MGSERFEDHIGLAHTLAHKAYGRAQKMGSSLEYMDLFQEVAFAFVKANDGFDPTKGWKFSTFLTTCVWNHMNGHVFKKEERHVLELGVMSIEDLSNDEGDDPMEFLSGTTRSPQDVLELRQEVARQRERFSPMAKVIVDWMLDPPQELTDECTRAKAYRVLHEGEEEEPAAPGIRDVCEYLALAGANPRQLSLAKAEVMRFAKQL